MIDTCQRWVHERWNLRQQQLLWMLGQHNTLQRGRRAALDGENRVTSRGSRQETKNFGISKFSNLFVKCF
jgi:hypothetical protein